MTNKDISKYYADENVARLIAAQIVVIALLSLLTQWTFPAFFLTADFALRAFTYQPSPLAAIAKLLADLYGLPPKLIFAAPKKFAAGVGFVFSLAVFVLFLFHLYIAAWIVGGVLIFFAVLEAVFRIYVGCYVYDKIVAPFVNKKN